MKNLLKSIFTHYIRLIISFVLGIGIFITYLAVKDGWTHIVCYLDAAFIAAALDLAIGLLSFFGNIGTFNIFSFMVLRKTKDNGYKEDFYEYGERKKLERAKDKTFFMPYIFTGLLFLIASFIILAFCK